MNLLGISADYLAPHGSSDFLRPDPLQRPQELPLAHGSCQVPWAQDAPDPPDLETRKGKGEESQLDVTPVQTIHTHTRIGDDAVSEP